MVSSAFASSGCMSTIVALDIIKLRELSHYGDEFDLPACSCSFTHFMCLPGKSPVCPSSIKAGADSIFVALAPHSHLLTEVLESTNFSYTCPFSQRKSYTLIIYFFFLFCLFSGY